MGLLIAWWFVVASYVAFFDFVSARATNISPYASVVDQLWYAVLCNGLIGALYAERHRIFYCLVSVAGGLVALAAMVFAVTMVSRLLAA